MSLVLSLIMYVVFIGGLVTCTGRPRIAPLVAIFCGLAWYAVMPVLSFHFAGWMVMIILPMIFIPFLPSGVNCERKRLYPFSFGVALNAAHGAASTLMVVLVVVGVTTTSAIFHASEYRNLIGEVRERKFTDDFNTIDRNQIRMVDAGIAKRRGEELLGTITGLGSRVAIGDFAIQSVNGKLQWIAPLEHDGFWRWMFNNTTPGYIRVSATDIRDAEIVTTRDGKPFKFRVGLGAWFGDSLVRHIYTQYPTIGITDYTMEIDDSGNPFWVATTYDHKIGFDGDDATGIIVVDPQSGEMIRYENGNIPDWVDRVIPSTFVVDQINDWGTLVHGWFNPEDRDKMTSTHGISLIYSNTGHPMWYTGMQSIKNDQGTMGFVLVDSHSKKATFYKVVGATEDGGRHSIEGKVQNYNWSASDPILYNISGVPSYISTLKDKAGNFKGIGIVSVENRSVVEVGETVADAIRKYENALRSQGVPTALNQTNTRYAFSGIITRMNTEVTDGTTYYYLTIGSVPNKAFMGNAKTGAELVLAKVGDSVRIVTDDSTKALINIIDFDLVGVDFVDTLPIGTAVR